MGRSRLVVVALASATVLTGCSPKAPTPAELMRGVAQSYRNAKTFWVEAKMHAEQTQPGQPKQEINASLVHAGDTLGHLAIKMNAEAAAAWLIANGTDLWVYQSGMGQAQYAQLANASTDSLTRSQLLERLLQAQFPALPLARYREAEVLADSATLEREEKLKVGDREVDCYVVRTSSPIPGAPSMTNAPVTLWIEKKAHIVWKELREASTTDPQGVTRQIREQIDYQRVSFDQPLPDSLFAFTPPPGALQIPVPMTPPPAR